MTHVSLMPSPLGDTALYITMLGQRLSSMVITNLIKQPFTSLSTHSYEPPVSPFISLPSALFDQRKVYGPVPPAAAILILPLGRLHISVTTVGVYRRESGAVTINECTTLHSVVVSITLSV